LKKLGDQAPSLITTLVVIACHKTLLTELKKHNLNDKLRKKIIRNLLTKRAIANAYKTDLYVAADCIQYFAANPSEIISELLENSIDKETMVKNFKTQKVFDELIKRMSWKVSFYEGKITFKKMSEHLRKQDKEIQALVDMIKKDPQLIASDERVIQGLFLKLYIYPNHVDLTKKLPSFP
jgi:hypothetical protein